VDENIKDKINKLSSTDNDIRLDALQTVLKLTESRVDWVYEVWDELIGKLTNENSYQRSIGIMVLCNLAKSDTEDRLQASLDLILAHTKDEKFITSRQCIQNIWKVGIAGKANREKVLAHLEKRFGECADEKHSNLIRRDIIQSMKYIYENEKDDALLTKIQALSREEF
jgi:hypothetical protein